MLFTNKMEIIDDIFENGECVGTVKFTDADFKGFIYWNSNHFKRKYRKNDKKYIKTARTKLFGNLVLIPMQFYLLARR